MPKGKLRKFFPGGNTSQGFYSFYDHIIGQDARRIIVIKGGPGVGKSTLMRSIGQYMQDQGYDVEFHCCSSDNGSLDGVCIPSIGTALLDGTAPHVVDPKNPGAVDEILNLGEFWNEDLMMENKPAILASNKRVGRLFRSAYFSLAEGKSVLNEWESYTTEALEINKLNEVYYTVPEEIFGSVNPDFRSPAKTRRLFATAITPDGPMNYLNTILQDVKTLYAIKGEPGTGKATFVGSIARQSEALGLTTEAYHCSFVPQNIDIVVIPQLETAVANLSAPVSFDPSSLPNLVTCKEFDFSSFLNDDILAKYKDELASCRKRFEQAFNRAVSFLTQAKAEHDLMESFYVPAMDFAAINAKKEEVLARILKYAKKEN